jgi:predicted polyphosphate/ATP-dependent NAD kinase
MYRIGFIVNPVAGMGGAVGLKGTDGVLAEAIMRGAHPRAPSRAKQAMSLVADAPVPVEILTCSGAMGEEVLKDAGIASFRIVYHYTGESTALNTKAAARHFMEHGVNLIVFSGGDGTARDIAEVTGPDVPLLGIPAGVKMYSSVFALDPASAAAILRYADLLRYHDAEIVDVDEEAYRSGDIRTRVFGIVRSPHVPGRTQVTKGVFEDPDEERAKDEIATFMLELLRDDTLYILGAGTTTEHLAGRMHCAKTLLGVDALYGGNVIAADANETTLLGLLARYPRVRILLSPIGAQGFILGRGSQQISPAVVRAVGIRNIIVLATPGKLSRTGVLYVDTGDPALDREFGTSIQVICGYRLAQRKRIGQPVETDCRNGISPGM